MAKPAALDPAVAGVLGRPFQEQAAFFRGKLGKLLPTATWKDVLKSQHDKAFMVAGAAQAGLLADLAAAVDRAIVEGKSLDAFRQDFGKIVEKNGWSPRGERNWRTRTIYRTNVATSYSAGRVAQLKEGGYGWWVYRHNDSVVTPRPEHVAWDGLALPANDPWWRTHTPPNGWGCQCYVVGARTAEDARALGGRVEAAPDEGLDASTGEPKGIDEGWGYQPGASVADEVRAAAAQTQQWDYVLAKAYMQSVPEGVRDELARAYRDLPSVADDARRYAARILAGERTSDIRTFGLLTSEQAAKVQAITGLDVTGYDLSMDYSSVGHVNSKHGEGGEELKRGQRPVRAEDYGLLPALINAAGQELEDVDKMKTGAWGIGLEQALGGDRYTVVWELRTKRKTLTLKTYYIHPTKK